MKIVELDITNKDNIKEQYQLSDLCAKVLASKNLNDDEIEELLEEPALEDPMSVQGMQLIVNRVNKAKQNHEKVLVCGDYDADGICATTILYETLGRYGIEAGFYIPNRFKEGYGLSVRTVEMAKRKGYSLLITVDNGVKAFDALNKAEELNIDVILTDHHAMDDTPLSCLYLLHPQHMGDAFQYLCGAGVALEISRALIGDNIDYIVLACVASIGDMMPLWKETRAIVKLGIQYLNEGYMKPIQLLSSDYNPVWDETAVAFQIVPKLNATGRLADMANTNNTVRYLLLRNPEQLKKVAGQINYLNTQRKEMSQQMSDYARSLITADEFQVLYDETFHEGMVGLVAGKLSEELQKPVMVLAKQGESMKGSIRSYGDLDLTTFFQDFDGLNAYGGHKAAAGIGLNFEKLDALKTYINEKMKTITLSTEKLCEVISVSSSEISLKEVESLQCLKPFGQGFSSPLFKVDGLHITARKQLSNQQHVKFVTAEEVDCMKFQASDEYERSKLLEAPSFIGEININRFRSNKKVNIIVDTMI